MAFQKNPEFYFQNHRLSLSLPSRFILRILSYTTYLVLLTASVTFLVSDIKNMQWLGLGIALFLLDKILHSQSAKHNLLFNIHKKVNSSNLLTPPAYHLLEKSLDQYLISHQDLSLIIFSKIIERSEFRESLARLEISPYKLSEAALKYLDKSTSSDLSGLEQISNFVNQAARRSLNAHLPYIEPAQLLLAVLDSNSDSVNSLLRSFSLTASDLNQAVIWRRAQKRMGFQKNIPSSLGGFSRYSNHYQPRIMNRAWTARPTPTLDRYSTDLTALARQESIGFLIGHTKKYDSLEDILSKPNRPNLLLLGRPGSGKKSLLAHLAFRIVKDQTPKPLFDQRLVSLNLSRLTAGVEIKDAKARLSKVVDEINSAKNIILVIDQIDRLVTAENESTALADIILPLVEHGHVSVIGTLTKANYQKLSETSPGLMENFTPLEIEEITPSEAELILSFSALVLENQYRRRLKVTIPAVKACVSIARRYLTDTPLPSSALKLLEETVADSDNKAKLLIKADDVIAIAERKVNIPLHNFSQSESDRLLNLEAKIHERLINQSEAVKAVADSLRQYRSGLGQSGQPIASFLFLGPTGVGKTELAKILADLEFGSSKMIVRLDMSEFQDKDSLVRLLGSKDGETPGALSDALLRRPYSLILLDEFEKAHPDILNLFLQVLDEGRLTDNRNRTINFDNTIIIATSNAYSTELVERLKNNETMSAISSDLKDRLTQFFKPELLNRFSKIIAFSNLSLTHLTEITKLKLNSLAKSIADTHSLRLNFTDQAIAAITKLGYDPAFGARPLNAAINDHIKNALADKILRQEIKAGSAVNIDYSDETNGFTFTSLD